jgi:hypothetical protein
MAGGQPFSHEEVAVLRKLLTFALLMPICVIITSSASAAATVPSKLQPIESRVAASVRSSKPPASYFPPLADFVPNNNLAGEGTLDVCDAYGNYQEIKNPVPCVEGDTSASRVIVLVGDSNVGNWAPGLSKGLSKANYKLDEFSFVGCPTSDITYVTGDYIGTTPSSCNEWHQSVLASIRKLSPVAVITASSGIGPQYNQKAWDVGYNTLFSKAIGNRPTVRRIVIGTSPYFPTPPPICLTRNPTAPLKCLLSTSTESIVGKYSSYASRDAAVAKAGGATLIQTSSLFCFDGKCPAEVGGTVTFVDNDHVTTAYSDEISAPLTNAVLTALK